MMKKNKKSGISKEERKAFLKKQYSQDKRKGNWYVASQEKLKSLGVKEVYKAKDGDNFISFLPQRNTPTFFQRIFVHFDVGGSKNSYLCPKEMNDNKCPVCIYLRKLRGDGEPDEVTYDFVPKKRYLFFIVDMDGRSNRNKGVQLYDAPKTVHEGIQKQALNPKTKDFQDVSDIDENLTFFFEKEGKMRNTKYTGFQLIESTKPINEKLLKKIPDFSEILIEPDIKAMKEDLMGISDEDEVETSVKKGKKKSKKSNELEDKKSNVRDSVKKRKKKKYKDDEDEDDLPF